MHNPRTTVTDGLLFALLYCLAYLAAWFHSLDQWLLPVGLRAAVLLLAPRRLLGWWLLGDVAVMYLMRVPRAPFDGRLWAYATPLLVGPIFALVPLALRRLLRTPRAVAAWLPLIAPACGLWSWACSWALSLPAISPNAFANVETGLTWSIGATLGVYLVTLPWLLWTTRSTADTLPDDPLIRDALMSTIVIGAIAFAVGRTDELAAPLRQSQ